MRKNFQVWKTFEACLRQDYDVHDEVYYTIKKHKSDDLHGPFTAVFRTVPGKLFLRNRSGVELPAFPDDQVQYWRPVA